MPRPRSLNPRVPMSISLPADLAEKLKSGAEGAGVSASVYTEAIIRKGFGERPPATPRTTGCAHPLIKKLGRQCTACGEKVYDEQGRLKA